MKKVALITGASAGIGKELAVVHTEKGGDVILVARREDRLVQLKKELEQKHNCAVHVIAKDLTEENASKEVFETIKNQGLEVDYLINNAGFGGHGKFHEREWQHDLDMIKLNIIALTELTRLFLPEFVKRKSGKVLNVSSTASLLPGPLQAVYFATKAYVTSFSNAIAEELRGTNVTVTALLPGATETEFAQTSGMENTDLFKKTYSAYEVALAGYNGMLAGKLDVLAGLSFIQKMMMATIPLTPKKLVLNQVRKMQEIK